ncbi:hypothetical protein VZT92_019164 [Zoarces viviparus]|uniref:Uncharacterized protein n=1 Tax=Zoarces viviparus TaxID=48416 RepID=A0AAW1EJT4_ZOAVI
MGNQKPYRLGAQAHQEPDDPAPQDAAAGLLKLSLSDDRRRGEYSQVPSDLSGSAPTSTSEQDIPHMSGVRLERTPSPTRREVDQPPLDFNDYSQSDSLGPLRVQSLRTDYIESLTKDVDRFDPNTHYSSIDNSQGPNQVTPPRSSESPTPIRSPSD